MVEIQDSSEKKETEIETNTETIEKVTETIETIEKVELKESVEVLSASTNKVAMKYSCKYCDYKCQRKNELQIHKNDEHKIIWDLCKFETFSEDDFEEHMKTDHDICQAKEHFCDKTVMLQDAYTSVLMKTLIIGKALIFGKLKGI